MLRRFSSQDGPKRTERTCGQWECKGGGVNANPGKDRGIARVRF